MYNYTLPSTSALDWGGWSTPRPGRFTPGKTRYPLCRRLGGPQSRSGRVQKISPPPGFDPRAVQPEASRYSIPALRKYGSPVNNNTNTGHIEIFTYRTRDFLVNICQLYTIFLNRRRLKHKSFGQLLHKGLKHIILKY